MGIGNGDIAVDCGVSPSYVSQQKALLEVMEMGLDSGPIGRPRAIHKEAQQAIVDFIEDFPTARRDEVCDLLKDEFDISVAPNTVGRCLKELEITHKRVSRINIRCDEDLCTQFIADMTRYTPDQLVCLDESAANERTKDRKYGWSPRGQPCRVRESQRRSTRWSILPALTCDGWLDYEVFHGSFDGDRFFAFLERVVNKMNAWPAPQSVLILDNASIHHGWRVKELCRERGVELVYLPPYSPHLNPIEMAFHELKEWMRKNRNMGYDLEEDFEVFIHLAMGAICSSATARRYFRSCGYGEIDADYEESNSVRTESN
jgi:transposase